jgi:hypothetical protein
VTLAMGRTNVRISLTARGCLGAALIAVVSHSADGYAQDRRDAASSRSVTVVVCIARHADYVRSTAPASAASSGPQLLLTDVRSGTPTYNLAGLREAELTQRIGQRVEITGTVERARTTPVLTTAEGAVTGSVNTERPPAAGLTPDGAAAHEPSDALSSTVRTGTLTEPSKISDPAYLVAVLPALNASSFRPVAGSCAAPPDRVESAAAEHRNEQAPGAAAAPAQGRADSSAAELITARGCLVRQTAGGTALTPQSSPVDVLVLTNAALPQRDPVRGNAVPGSAPADAGSGTVPSAAGTTGKAPVDMATLSFMLAVPANQHRQMTEHVGDRVEVTGTLDTAATAAAGGRGETPQTAGAAVPAPGRVQVAPIETAHVSAPVRRIVVTAFRALGGACN